MKIKESIQMRLVEFLTLCKSHNVKNIYAFGSAVTENPKSPSPDSSGNPTLLGVDCNE